MFLSLETYLATSTSKTFDMKSYDVVRVMSFWLGNNFDFFVKLRENHISRYINVYVVWPFYGGWRLKGQMCDYSWYWSYTINLFHPSVALHIETSYLIWNCKSNDWFLYESQHWAEMFYPTRPQTVRYFNCL